MTQPSKGQKKALVTGITGQDGSYLADFLLSKGYEVHGLIRRSSTINTSRISHIWGGAHQSSSSLYLHHGDLSDTSSLIRLLNAIRPHEIYNLAAQSHVRISFDTPEYTADVTGVAVVRLLESIRNMGGECRFYQASSSEMYGGVQSDPQDENTPFYPRSPYAAAKAFAYFMTRNYREAYGLFAVNGILFNHESPRRGETFVTRKITRALSRIKYGLQDKLYLGNLSARRDWGYAGDYVEAMWKMLQVDEPEDFVVATGETHSVKEFLETAAEYAGVDAANHLEIDPHYQRPTEVDVLIGDISKTREKLGWSPKVSFKELIKMMVDSDLELAVREKGSAG